MAQPQQVHRSNCVPDFKNPFTAYSLITAAQNMTALQVCWIICLSRKEHLDFRPDRSYHTCNILCRGLIRTEFVFDHRPCHIHAEN